MNRAIADEKMRLIIENQRKEKKVKSKTKPKKPSSASTKEFEYVEKLKEINTRMMYQYGISKSRHLNYYNSWNISTFYH